MQTNVNGVTITLTKEQIEEIHKQTCKFKVEDINGYEDACEILSEKVNSSASSFDKMNTIIRAANFIDNGNKIWKPDFMDTKQRKYYPYYEVKSNHLVFDGSLFSYFAYGQVCFYLKEETSTYIGKKFINLYQEIHDRY